MTKDAEGRPTFAPLADRRSRFLGFRTRRTALPIIGAVALVVGPAAVAFACNQPPGNNPPPPPACTPFDYEHGNKNCTPGGDDHGGNCHPGWPGYDSDKCHTPTPNPCVTGTPRYPGDDHGDLYKDKNKKKRHWTITCTPSPTTPPSTPATTPPSTPPTETPSTPAGTTTPTPTKSTPPASTPTITITVTPTPKTTPGCSAGSHSPSCQVIHTNPAFTG